jgi:hypothetical protein
MTGMPCLEPTWNSAPRLLVMGSEVVKKKKGLLKSANQQEKDREPVLSDH